MLKVFAFTVVAAGLTSIASAGHEFQTINMGGSREVKVAIHTGTPDRPYALTGDSTSDRRMEVREARFEIVNFGRSVTVRPAQSE